MAGFTNPYSKPTSAGQNPYAAPSRPQASAAQPGQAQSIPPRPQGTPYQSYTQQAQSAPSKPQGTPYQAYSQGGQSAAGGYQGFDPSMGRPTLRPASQQVTGDWQGGYASAPPSQRPPAFQAGPAQTPWGQSADPFADRNAFINQVNQQRMQNQIAFNSSGPTNPADQMTPGINYQQAMQQADLGGGSPSMSSDYGDSLIQRLNQNFAGPGNPFTSQPTGAYNFAAPPQGLHGLYAAGTDITQLPFTDTMQPNPAYIPPSNPYQPYVNQQGQAFQGSMSFAPGTPQSYQNQAYGNFANQQGYYQPPSQGPKRSPREIAGDFYDPNPGGAKLMVVQNWYNPQTGESFGGTGVAPRPGTGWVQGVSPQEQLSRDEYIRSGGRPPLPPPPANDTTRTDPGSGKTVTYKDGQWTWQPNPISGPQPYDTSRFGDGTPHGQQPVPPSRQPAYSRPGQAQPIAPPSQGTPYQQPTATSPAPPREPSASPPSNADRTAFDAENKKKMDRLGQLRKQQFAYIKNKKGGGYTPPSWDKEYQDLTRWALSQDTLSSVNDQQFAQIADWFPSTFGGNPNVLRRR